MSQSQTYLISHSETLHFSNVYFRNGFAWENKNSENEILEIGKFREAFF